MTRTPLALALTALAALAPSLFAGAPAQAKSWCARPLWVHEWGVHVFASDGQPTPLVGLPSYFHGAAPARIIELPAVRNLPADSGIRLLPVLHFYAAGAGAGAQAIPVGVEVGFSAGDATVWFPAVDVRRPAAEANGPAATAARTALLAARAKRTPYGAQPPLPTDPTRQLVWEHLSLTPAPTAAPAATDAAWVKTARELDALWVNTALESERFVFYEAGTSEALPLTLRRGPAWTKDQRHYVLANRGRHDVHDLFVVHREGRDLFVFTAARLPAGQSVAFRLEDQRVTDARAATWGALRTLLTDASPPDRTGSFHDADGDCVMGRDPALPVEAAAGHRLYPGEVDTLLGAWGARLFDQPGTTIVYREDAAALDAAMPLAIYTDMFHFVVLHRAGLALWEHVTLP